MERDELIEFGSRYVSRQADRIKTQSEQMLSEAEALRNRMAFRRLFSGQITSAQAAEIFGDKFRRENLSGQNVIGKLALYHQMFQEGNFVLTQKQMVAWDNMVICLETAFEVPEEERISNNRLVPIGTPSNDPNFEDLAF